ARKGTTALMWAPEQGVRGPGARNHELHGEYTIRYRMVTIRASWRGPLARTMGRDGVWTSPCRERTFQRPAPGRAHPLERRRLGPGRARADRRAGRDGGRRRAAGAPAGRDQGQLLLALPVARGAAGGRAGALGAGRAGRSVRPARGDPRRGPAPARAVRPGRAR